MAHQVRHLILACALLLVAPWAVAQTPGKISIRFTVFSPRPVEGIGYVSATGVVIPLTFNPLFRSAHQTYSGPSALKFVDAATRAVVAEASIPPEIREPLLLFSELPAGAPRGLRYQVSVLDDSAAKLPPGHLTILNFSGLKFSATLDKSQFTVGEGLSAPVPIVKPVKLTLFTMARGARVQSYAEVIKPPKRARLLLILFPPSRKGALEVQTRVLADDLSSPPPPSGAPVKK